jgi:predicted HAD superfamily phosphohydrolase YqeG
MQIQTLIKFSKAFLSYLKVKFLFVIYFLNKEVKTVVFDFDETLAKVAFDKSIVPNFEEQIDILTKNKTYNVSSS